MAFSNSNAGGGNSGNSGEPKPFPVVGKVEAINQGMAKLRDAYGNAVVVALKAENGKRDFSRRPDISDENFKEGSVVHAEGCIDTGEKISGQKDKDMKRFDADWLTNLHQDAVMMPNHVAGAFQHSGGFNTFMLDARTGAKNENATEDSVTESLGLAYDRAIADREAGAEPEPDGVMMGLKTQDGEFDGVAWASLFTRSGSGDEDDELRVKTREEFIKKAFEAQFDNPNDALAGGRPTLGTDLDPVNQPVNISFMVGSKNRVVPSKYCEDYGRASTSRVGATAVQQPTPREGDTQLYRLGTNEARLSGVMGKNSPNQTPFPWADRMNIVSWAAGVSLQDDQSAQQTNRKDEEDDAFVQAGMAAN